MKKQTFGGVILRTIFMEARVYFKCKASGEIYFEYVRGNFEYQIISEIKERENKYGDDCVRWEII